MSNKSFKKLITALKEYDKDTKVLDLHIEVKHNVAFVKYKKYIDVYNLR